MNTSTLSWIISVIGCLTIIGIFLRMKPGFGIFNLRAVLLTIIIVFASLLALANTESLSAVFGILGAIAGYLFGVKTSDKKEEDVIKPK